jgi:hypothetical protein
MDDRLVFCKKFKKTFKLVILLSILSKNMFVCFFFWETKSQKIGKITLNGDWKTGNHPITCLVRQRAREDKGNEAA